MSIKPSSYFQKRLPSAIRLAQIKFMQRVDKVKAINLAIGNVTLPMHPTMIKAMKNLGTNSPFKNGVVPYSPTIGLSETNQTFLKIIASSGFKTKNLYSQITDGASQAMELMILGVCGDSGTKKKPLFLIDPTYTNYQSLTQRLGRSTVTISRHLHQDGDFTLPSLTEIESLIKKYEPGALIIIPYDNPTGQLFNHKLMVKLATLCVKYHLFLVSDEAYRELAYTKEKCVSIWGITEKEVPGITGHRISLETSSKVWNACGLRIGALVTDNLEFHQKAVAENTANLCSNVLGQYIFSSLNKLTTQELKTWYKKQRAYYQRVIFNFRNKLQKLIPGLIISLPQASIYSVIDFKKIVKPSFNLEEFILYCALHGKVKVGSDYYTLLIAPMQGFYNSRNIFNNPDRFQARIAYVEPEPLLKIAPYILVKLLEQYLTNNKISN